MCNSAFYNFIKVVTYLEYVSELIQYKKALLGSDASRPSTFLQHQCSAAALAISLAPQMSLWFLAPSGAFFAPMCHCGAAQYAASHSDPLFSLDAELNAG